MSNEKQETVADNVSANHQFREVAKMIPHEEVTVSKMETTTLTGNSAAMREALEAAIPIMRACLFDYYNTTDVNKVVGEMKAALSAPPRNCDVGTSEEQAERFYAFCGYHRFQSGIKGMCSSLCPCIRCRDMCSCITTWEQMPYEGGVTE